MRSGKSGKRQQNSKLQADAMHLHVHTCQLDVTLSRVLTQCVHFVPECLDSVRHGHIKAPTLINPLESHSASHPSLRTTQWDSVQLATLAWETGMPLVCGNPESTQIRTQLHPGPQIMTRREHCSSQACWMLESHIAADSSATARSTGLSL